MISACATTGARETRSPRHISELESAALESNDQAAQLVLAAAYLQSDRDQDAATLLERMAGTAGHPAEAAYFLGVAYEGLDRAKDARGQYSTYLQRGTSDRLRRAARGRIEKLQRLELEQAIRNSIAQEQTLSSGAAEARVVGVFPFLNSAGGSLAPLGRALAELLTIDLSQTERLTVVERAQVQRLLDEIRLAQSGSVDPATAVRAGKLLGAGQIVQGSVDGSEADLRLQALVVPVATSGLQVKASASQQGAAAQLMSLQNNLALELYSALGVELTVAERERVMRQPTQNVQALLAFGFGLEAEDAGRYSAAVRHFREATGLDNGFSEGLRALERAEAAAASSSDSVEGLLLEGVRELEADLLMALIARSRFQAIGTIVPNPENRDPVSEMLGTEGFDRQSLLNFLIRRPQ
jgi:TolB-like protein